MKYSRVTLIKDNYNSSVGGDNVQIAAIYKFLRGNGYEVIIRSDAKECKKGELVFLFNLTRPYELFYNFHICRINQVEFIFIPIYWDIDKEVPIQRISLRLMKGILSRDLFNQVKWLKNIIFKKKYRSIGSKYYMKWRFMRSMVNEIMSSAEHTFVNSYAEKLHLVSTFHLDEYLNKKISICYNGIEYDIEDLVKYDFVPVDDNYVCCVGAIGPRKNQLNIVRAIKDIDVTIYIIGSATKRDKKYLQKVKRYSSANVKFIEHLSRPQALGYIKNSRGLIQASFIETPGLAAMEAISLGKPIVVSDVQPVKEYFKGNAVYCDPNNVSSIEKAIMTMVLNNEPIDSMEFRKQYQWNRVLLPILDFLNGTDYRV